MPIASSLILNSSSSSSTGAGLPPPARKFKLVDESRADVSILAGGTGAGGGSSPASVISSSICLDRAVATAAEARRVFTISMRK